MKKLAFLVAALTAVMLAMAQFGCDDSSDSDSAPDGYVETATVEKISEPPAIANAARSLRCGNWNVVVLTTASIQRQRPSCSGFDNAGPGDIKIGDIIEFDVPEDVTTYYPVQQTIPTHIKAYRSECVYKPASTNDCHKCPPCGTGCTGACGGNCG